MPKKEIVIIFIVCYFLFGNLHAEVQSIGSIWDEVKEFRELVQHLKTIARICDQMLPSIQKEIGDVDVMAFNRMARKLGMFVERVDEDILHTTRVDKMEEALNSLLALDTNLINRSLQKVESLETKHFNEMAKKTAMIDVKQWNHLMNDASNIVRKLDEVDMDKTLSKLNGTLDVTTVLLFIWIAISVFLGLGAGIAGVIFAVVRGKESFTKKRNTYQEVDPQ